MKPKEALSAAKANLRELILRVIENICRDLEACLRAKTPEDFINRKADLMLDMLEFPISTRECPYCPTYIDLFCRGCPYPKPNHHGKCEDPESTYGHLLDSLVHLRNAINAYRMPEEKEKKDEG